MLERDETCRMRLVTTSISSYGKEGLQMAGDQITISSKYQIVIPKAAREKLGLRPGQKLGVLIKGKTITLVPVPTLDELQGFAKGINLDGYREEADRL